MPWEKSFSESDVIEQAMHVFWKKGYAATSISDITEATGIKRGSLYNAFDGKDDLFIQSLLRYKSERMRELFRELRDLDDPRKAIVTFFKAVVNDSHGNATKKGCFLVNTSLELPQHSQDVQDFVKNTFKDIERFFVEQIKLGQQRGHIPQTVSPRSTAKSFVATIVGIRVLGRGTLGKSSLKQVADQAISQLS